MSRGWEKKGHYYWGTMDGPDVLPETETENDWAWALGFGIVAALLMVWIVYAWPWQVTP